MIKLVDIFNERMGHNDTNLQQIMRKWDQAEPGSFTRRKIGSVVIRDPNASREEVYDRLRDIGYEDVRSMMADLGMQESKLNEEKIKTEEFEDFSTKRQAGAEKISKNAKEKGGISLLTYEHFVVKLPYYEKAKQGKFDPEQGKREYKKLLDRLVEASEDVNMSQKAFQRLVGKIEVVGELIIKSKEK
jgi:hypothetical protein